MQTAIHESITSAKLEDTLHKAHALALLLGAHETRAVLADFAPELGVAGGVHALLVDQIARAIELA